MKEKKKAESKQEEGKKKKKASVERGFLAVYIFILFATFFKIYPSVYDKKVAILGDNAAYYILGQSIALGEGYVDIQKKVKPPHKHFPPGYPLIIAGTSKLFSSDIQVIKRANGFFLFLSVAISFLIFYKLANSIHLAFISSLLLLLNTHLLRFSTIMMSEVPFMFFVSLCLFLFINTDYTKPLKTNWQFFLLIIVTAFTYYIRTVGIAIFVGFAGFLLFKKHWKYLISLIAGFFLAIFPWYLRNSRLGGNAYVHQLLQKNIYRPELGQMDLMDWFKRFWVNMERYITREIPSGMFNYIVVPNYKAEITSGEWIIGIIICIFLIIGLFKIKKYRQAIIFYVLAFLGILFLWPEVWTGIRFILPLLPLLTLLFAIGIHESFLFIAKKIIKPSASFNFRSQVALVILTFILIPGYLKTLKAQNVYPRSSYDKKFQNYIEAAEWVKKNTPDTAVVCCRKPNLFYLFSQRCVTKYKNTLDVDELINSLEESDVDYVIFDALGYSSTARYLFPAVKRDPEKFPQKIHLKDPDTYVLGFTPELGYKGEWKDDKREGRGTYTWRDKKRYEGEWKNNQRNGKGILYFPNGQYLEAIWKDDKLEGQATLKMRNGKIIHTSIYKDNKMIKMIK